jgi:endonuclease YncB( thermonuclease family)
VTIGVVALVFSLPSNLFGGVAPVDGTIRVDANAVAVVDGETLVLNNDVVRLRGVAAPARGVMCGGADGAAFDCGAAAARALAALVRDAALTCRLAGRDSRGFVQADCLAAGTNINQAIVAAGWARVQAADNAAPAFSADEQQARAARRGIWADPDAASRL